MVGGIAGFLGKKQKRSLGVCIPEPRSKQAEKEAAKALKGEEKALGPGGFHVEGIFHFHDSLMLQGTAVGATIRKKATAKIDGVKLAVSDILVNQRRTSMISDGEKGALFLKAPKDRYPFIRIGDFVEF